MYSGSDGGTLTALRYPTVGVATRNWLNAESARLPWIKDLTDQWSLEVESQIQMDETMGSPVYDGAMNRINGVWQYDDNRFGSYQFYHLRIPKGSMTDEASYSDRELRFPLDLHVEAIGMTGWDWKNKRSLSWGYDFDSITGHAAGVGISDEELEEVARRASEIDYAEVRRSTGGAGIHLRIYNSGDEEVTNHNMHKAAARAALQQLSKDVGFNFAPHVDVFGQVMWIWHRKINEVNQGLKLIKAAVPDSFPGLPENWKDHEEVISGKRSKIRINGIGNQDAFEALAAARERVTIDETHRLAEERIGELGYSIVWQADHNCWQTHTKAFQDLLDEYPDDYKGFYETLSAGNDPGKPNCFVFPLTGGAFKVVKFGQGAREHDTWNQNGTDWTWTVFNRVPSLRVAGLRHDGAEDVRSKGVAFAGLEAANKTLADLGGSPITLESLSRLENGDRRQVTLSTTDDGRVLVNIAKSNKDPDTMPGWIKRQSGWERVLNVSANVESAFELDNLDAMVRGVVDTENNFAYWKLFDKSKQWVEISKDNAKTFLRSVGFNQANIEDILGQAIYNPWRIVNIPFASEYPGGRQWNHTSAQLAVMPAPIPSPHPTWDKVLEHQGRDLDKRIHSDRWFNTHGVRDGASYLRAWIANLIRHPFGRLPYLFFFGPQDSGKSTFHEAVSLLMTGGVVRGDTYLQGRDNFNGHLAAAVLCVVEETDLGKNDGAYNRLKDIITAEEILINAKYQKQYMLRNATSWVQCANHAAFCPVIEGDTRVTSSFVDKLSKESLIPKPELLATLKAEAPAFLRTLLDLRLPPLRGRLLLPPLGLSDQTDNYQDSTGIYNFVENHVEAGEDFRVTINFAYKKYRESCGGSFLPVTEKKFRAALIDAGLVLAPGEPKAYHEEDPTKRMKAFGGFRIKT